MIDGNAGYGLHTAMSKNGTMITYNGYRNSLYESGFGLPDFNSGIFDFSSGRCCHHHSCGNDSGFEKAIGWGLVGGLGLGLGIAFAKPIGKALSVAGKGIASAAKWCWNGIKSIFSKKSTKAKQAENVEKNTPAEKVKDVDKAAATDKADKAD